MPSISRSVLSRLPLYREETRKESWGENQEENRENHRENHRELREGKVKVKFSGGKKTRDFYEAAHPELLDAVSVLEDRLPSGEARVLAGASSGHPRLRKGMLQLDLLRTRTRDDHEMGAVVLEMLGAVELLEEAEKLREGASGVSFKEVEFILQLVFDRELSPGNHRNDGNIGDPGDPGTLVTVGLSLHANRAKYSVDSVLPGFVPRDLLLGCFWHHPGWRGSVMAYAT